MYSPARPAIRILRPFRSWTVRISLRNQPPIWAPVLPQGMDTVLKRSKNGRSASRPPPEYSHALSWRVFMPKGMVASKAKVGSLPTK